MWEFIRVERECQFGIKEREEQLKRKRKISQIDLEELKVQRRESLQEILLEWYGAGSSIFIDEKRRKYFFYLGINCET